MIAPLGLALLAACARPGTPASQWSLHARWTIDGVEAEITGLWTEAALPDGGVAVLEAPMVRGGRGDPRQLRADLGAPVAWRGGEVLAVRTGSSIEPEAERAIVDLVLLTRRPAREGAVIERDRRASLAVLVTRDGDHLSKVATAVVDVPGVIGGGSSLHIEEDRWMAELADGVIERLDAARELSINEPWAWGERRGRLEVQLSDRHDARLPGDVQGWAARSETWRELGAPPRRTSRVLDAPGLGLALDQPDGAWLVGDALVARPALLAALWGEADAVPSRAVVAVDALAVARTPAARSALLELLLDADRPRALRLRALDRLLRFEGTATVEDLGGARLCEVDQAMCEAAAAGLAAR